MGFVTNVEKNNKVILVWQYGIVCSKIALNKKDNKRKLVYILDYECTCNLANSRLLHITSLSIINRIPKFIQQMYCA